MAISMAGRPSPSRGAGPSLSPQAGARAVSVLVPGDDKPDPELAQLSTLEPLQMHRLWQY